MPRIKKEEVTKKEIKTLKDACEANGLEYREGVTRLIDLAKVLKVGYSDGMTLEDVLKI